MPVMRVEEKIHDQNWKKEVKKKIKEKKASSKCDVNIGKKGLSEEVIKEIRRQLKIKGVVKIRILKTALEVTGLDRRSIAREVASKTGARLIEVRGRTFILAKTEADKTGV